MRILAVSVTEAGRRMAARLPFEHVHGRAGAVVAERWSDVDGLVLFLATGAAVRIVAPLLVDKHGDPGVVCVDEAGRFAVALCGGHQGGANALARRVATLLGAEPVVTTATDSTGTTALDLMPGLVAEGDVAGVTVAMLAGRCPRLDNPLDWPVAVEGGDGPERVLVSDLVVAGEPGLVVLRPPSLVVGVGTSTGAPPEAVGSLVGDTLAAAGLARASVAELATIDRRGREPALLALGLPMRTYDARTLAAVTVPTPSPVVMAAVGTPSVCEAAALLAAGPGARLVVAKRRNEVATVAVARRVRRRGHLALVGLGPGSAEHRTPAADDRVRRAEVVIGYGPYVEQCADLVSATQEVIRSPIGEEVVRAKQALAEAWTGRRVALVCSGDAGVYAMASIVLELAGEQGPDVDIDVEVVPGVTAALAASALLGAPLGHDHVSISLSDLLTPWPHIETRLRAAAEADLVVALYNPRSRGRSWQLDAARQVLLEHRRPTTPVGVVNDAGRVDQRVVLTTLAKLDTSLVDMTTTVIVGSSTTRVVSGRMVTPRGYLP